MLKGFRAGLVLFLSVTRAYSWPCFVFECYVGIPREIVLRGMKQKLGDSFEWVTPASPAKI